MMYNIIFNKSTIERSLIGDGVFETIKIVNKKILNFHKHFKRLQKSCNLLYIPFKIRKNELSNLIYKSIYLNKLVYTKEIVARITVTRGYSERGIFQKNDFSISPNIYIYTKRYINIKKILHIGISTIIKNEYSSISRIKSINYLENILVKIKAIKNNLDDALILNTKSNIISTSSANIFFKKNNILYTPCIDDGIFPGITRGNIIKKYNVIERPISINEINSFDEYYISNSLIGKKRFNFVFKYV